MHLIDTLNNSDTSRVQLNKDEKDATGGASLEKPKTLRFEPASFLVTVFVKSLADLDDAICNQLFIAQSLILEPMTSLSSNSDG